jgi:class 3 adenylate cyclase/DNA-binding CsgD family transcriptional regulator
MPLYMDRHEMPEAAPGDVAQAHVRDVKVQSRYGVNYITYWMGEGLVHCLVEAPSKDAAISVHREAHEAIPATIIEVTYGSIEEIFGRVYEPQPGEAWQDSAVRTMMFSRIADPAALFDRVGDAQALAIFREHERIAQDAVESRGGVYVKRDVDAAVGCFASVAGALQCAIAIRQTFAALSGWLDPAPALRIGMSTGEPVSDHGELFGAVIQQASAVCNLAEPGQILTSSIVRALSIGKGFQLVRCGERLLPGFEEPVALFEVTGGGPPDAIAGQGAEDGGGYPDHISGREVEVLRLVAHGHTNQEIADELVISLNTVRRHVSNIFDKTGLANRAEAVSYAHRHDLA